MLENNTHIVEDDLLSKTDLRAFLNSEAERQDKGVKFKQSAISVMSVLNKLNHIKDCTAVEELTDFKFFHVKQADK